MTWGTRKRDNRRRRERERERERQRNCIVSTLGEIREEGGKALNEWIVRLAKCGLKSVREPMFAQVGWEI
jgi:hypothetical protein